MLSRDPAMKGTLGVEEVLVTGDHRGSYRVKFMTGGILDMQKYVAITKKAQHTK